MWGLSIPAYEYSNSGTSAECHFLNVLAAKCSSTRTMPSSSIALCLIVIGLCILMQMQRDWKTSQVQDLLERIGEQDPATFPSTLPTLGTDEVYNYRSKITPHYDRPIKSDIGDMKIREIGFKRKTNRQLVDVPYCHIATEAINEQLAMYREGEHAA